MQVNTESNVTYKAHFLPDPVKYFRLRYLIYLLYFTPCLEKSFPVQRSKMPFSERIPFTSNFSF